MNKKLFSFTLMLMLICLMATSAWAAKKIDFVSGNGAGYIQKMNSQSDHGHNAMGTIFGLIANETLMKARESVDINSVTHARYQQLYKGIPIWGMQTVVSRDHTDEVLRIDGTVALDVPKDILNIPGTLDPRGALKRMQKLQKAKNANAVWNFSNEKYGTYIYVDKKNKANLCYMVSFFADNDKGNPERPIFFIDVKTGKIIDSYNMLTTAAGTGPGGNQKTGQYEYGTDYPGFGVTVNGSTYTMNTANVKTVDLNHGTSGSTAYSYTGPRNTHESINGGYCPLNDGQYFGQMIYDMYQNWYGLPVLPFQLTMKLHYSTNYENAFWDGSAMTFGDGYTTFYPLCSLDVSAHEISHGFTENHSNLTYSSQSGGINEAFSDMAGEAAKLYMKGTNDFKCGYDIFKSPSGALRYMYNPPLDGASIDHLTQYYEGLDVHYSCGIFNKAFYLIATTSGWTTRMAFDIFVKANTDYWTPGTNFQQGAEDVLQAARDYNYPCAAVVAAFANVGIKLTCSPPVAAFVGTPTAVSVGGTVAFTDQSTNTPTSWSWSFPGATPSTSTAKNPLVVYNMAGTYNVSLTATNAYGSNTLTKSNYINVSKNVYCTTKGKIQSDEWIARIEVGSLTNSSSASPYSNFTNLTANISSVGPVNYTLVPGFSGSPYYEYWRIFIDYNKDSDFTEANETCLSVYGTSTKTGNFTVASGVSKGKTRMRISMKYGAYPTSCETFSYGEVEDYTVNII